MKKNCLQRTRSSCASTTCIISDLPNNVLENILMLLPMKDAARSSILSRKWRYIWAKLPQLIFDNTFVKESPHNLQASKDKLLLTIYQILLFHCAPIIKCTLSLSGLEGCSEIDQIILFLSRNGIEDFTLNIRKGERHKLPCHLFSCQQLKHLNLRRCVFQPPVAFRGFTKLTSLELQRVTFATEVIETFISSCPLLERLTLENFTTSDCLVIDAPNLKFLFIRDIFGSLCFKNTALLAEVSVDVDAHVLVDDELLKGNLSNVIEVFDSLPCVENLFMGYNFFIQLLAAGFVPKRLPTTLNHLKYLHITEICLSEIDEVSFALCLIKSSPNLVRIEIQFIELDGRRDANKEQSLEFLKAQDYSDVSLNQLREVQMCSVTGVIHELEFIKILLATSPKLKRLLIYPSEDTHLNRGFVLLKSLSRFERASPISQVIYMDP